MDYCFEEISKSDLKDGVHLSGIGGVGMTALAEILLDLGVEVTGSDVLESKNVLRLRAKGVKVFLEQKKENIGNKLVCRTRAVKDDNEEVAFAKKAVYRSSLLAYLAKGKKQIVVTGAHGKTTVSALLAHCMQECGFDISFAVGGLSPSLDRYGKVGSSEYFVLEGDESDGSHLKTDPYGAILTSCDVDHLAFWKKGENLQSAYLKFCTMVKEKKHFFFFGDDPLLAKQAVEGKSFGEKGSNDFVLENCNLGVKESSFEVHGKKVVCPMFGRYNMLNALSVYALLESFGVEHDAIVGAFSTFKGIMRRMEYLGKNIYSDYAHHPQEVKSVLKSLDQLNDDIQIVFEPHRLSRFQDELEGFCAVFKNVVITDVFEASEGLKIDQTLMLKEFCRRTNSTYIPLKEMSGYLKGEGKKVLAMSAGPLDAKLRKFVEENS